MKQPFTLNIPSPCSEKWSDFSPTDTGGFCSSCQKTVVDFTKMTDEEVVHFFASAPANACGRFRADQLKSYSYRHNTAVRPGLRLFLASFICVALSLLSRPGQAQATSYEAKTTIVAERKTITHAQFTTEEYTVKGVVKSREDKMILPGVNVVLKGSNIGTMTDADGYFEFPKKLKEGDVLVFSFLGLASKEFKVKAGKDQNIEIDLELMMDMDITGEVLVVGAFETPPNGLQKLWCKVKGIF